MPIAQGSNSPGQLLDRALSRSGCHTLPFAIYEGTPAWRNPRTPRTLQIAVINKDFATFTPCSVHVLLFFCTAETHCSRFEIHESPTYFEDGGQYSLYLLATCHDSQFKMGDYPYIVLSLLVAILNIAPFCWQLEHGNSGPACLGFWVILLNLNNFVSILWWLFP